MKAGTLEAVFKLGKKGKGKSHALDYATLEVTREDSAYGILCRTWAVHGMMKEMPLNLRLGAECTMRITVRAPSGSRVFVGPAVCVNDPWDGHVEFKGTGQLDKYDAS